uniref:Peptidase S1 domain-containing protein n=1 Tax=Glossina brevipalpis TaxID=37001 RepID=A0A1A9WGZ2_9MUSC
MAVITVSDVLCHRNFQRKDFYHHHKPLGIFEQIMLNFRYFWILIIIINSRLACGSRRCAADPSVKSNYSKRIVQLKYTTDFRTTSYYCGIVLTNCIILTLMLPPKSAPPRGEVLCGEPRTDTSLDDEDISSRIISFSKGRQFSDNKYSSPQAALIRTNTKLPGHVETWKLPEKEFNETGECRVISKRNLGGDIVEYEAKVLGKGECRRLLPDQEDDAICIDVNSCRYSHCELFANGAIFICNGALIGIVKKTEYCQSYKPRAVTNLYRLRNWLERTIKNLTHMQLQSKFAKHLAHLEFRTNKNNLVGGLGIILSKNLILTACVPNWKKTENIEGVAVYGLKVTKRKLPRFEDMPDPKKVQLALIKVDKNMELDAKNAAALPLPIYPPEIHAKCVVVHTMFRENEPIIETDVIIVDKQKCREQLPGLYEDSICVQIAQPTDDFQQCDVFKPGSPLVCDGTTQFNLMDNKDLLQKIVADAYVKLTVFDLPENYRKKRLRIKQYKVGILLTANNQSRIV